YGTKTRLSAELHLSYTNGTVQVIASDPTWKGGFGPILEGDMFDGETYDARLEMPGWDSPGYTNAAWTSVTTGAQVSPTIQAYPEEPVQVQRQIAPVAITNPQAGVYVINYGQSFAGWARLQVNEPAATRVVMQFGEWLNPDGTVYQGNYRTAKATDTYICKGGGTETWEPRFTYRAYQYVQITGLTQPPTINTMTGIVVNSSLPEVGSFQCSNGQINQMWSNMLWSLRTAYFDIPAAAQERDERMGWCDGIEIMRSGMFAMQTESFFSKWYQDIVDGKTSPTTFPQMAPTPWNFGFSSGWADCAIEVPYWLYQTYGDKRVAQRFYGQMQDHIDYYAANSSNFIGPNSGYGDWEAIDGSTPLNLVSTAFYAGCANEMAQMAQVLGNTSDAATYRQLFTNICAAFQSNFVTGNGTVGSGSEGSYVLALYYNLLTPAQRMLAGSNLVAAINAAGGNPTTGMVTTHMLLPVLTSIGRSDVAYLMLAKTNYPSWGYQIKLGATSYWELWNSVNVDGTFNTSEAGMNSLNIPNFGTIAEWFYRGILGIDLLQPGFQKILISPQIGGGLTSAQGSYNSIQGLITSAWQLTNNTLTLNVTIPANATAQINVPTTYANAIIESGVPAASSPGVTYVGVSNSIVAGVSTNTYAIYSVGSGNYVFSSPFLIPVPPTITMTNQTGSGSGKFYPSWTVVTNGSLIAGQAPSTALGNFSLEASGRSVNSLTTGTDLGINLINGVTTSTNYVTCGNSGGAGSTIIYTLTGPTNGYDLTNITVYGGWANNSRDQQAYTVYYSTVAAPTNFISLAVVNYNPSIGSGIQSATRVTLTSSNGVLAANVAAVKFDFTSPASENGYCGYAAITIFGTANVAPPIPAILGATMTANYLVLNFGSLVVGRNYTLQSTTNLASGVWSTETNFMATQSASVFTNFFINGAQKFYRVVGY
ncbi:MAG TPA: family 78 glycoside hydrolase catalytic domain, partial [Verrucomicrobiae bacterium]